MNHFEAIFLNILFIETFFSELKFNIFSVLHEKIKELLALFLHISFVFVNENWFHNELVKPMQVFITAGVDPPGSSSLLVWMEHSMITALVV